MFFGRILGRVLLVTTVYSWFNVFFFGWLKSRSGRHFGRSPFLTVSELGSRIDYTFQKISNIASKKNCFLWSKFNENRLNLKWMVSIKNKIDGTLDELLE